MDNNPRATPRTSICASCGKPRSKGSLTSWIFVAPGKELTCTCSTSSDPHIDETIDTLVADQDGEGDSDRETEQLSQDEDLTGKVISSTYQVLERIGQGGMSVVYKVRHRHLHELMAIKVIASDRALDQRDVARFKREAQAACSLSHENIVSVKEFNVDEKGRAFIVMQLAEGETLENRLTRVKQLSPAMTIKMALDVSAALAYAHKEGVVHRDIKPSNIIISTDANGAERFKILDFGIAKNLRGGQFDQIRVTQTGDVFGSPLYMSPEQCVGKPTDARTDVYSVGCVIYEALVGTPAYAAESVAETLVKHLSTDPELPKLSSAKPLNKIIYKCLRRNPNDRFQTMEELRQALSLADSEVAAKGTVKGWKPALIAAPCLIVVACLTAYLCTHMHPAPVPEQKAPEPATASRSAPAAANAPQTAPANPAAVPSEHYAILPISDWKQAYSRGLRDLETGDLDDANNAIATAMSLTRAQPTRENLLECLRLDAGSYRQKAEVLFNETRPKYAGKDQDNPSVPRLNHLYSCAELLMTEALDNTEANSARLKLLRDLAQTYDRHFRVYTMAPQKQLGLLASTRHYYDLYMNAVGDQCTLEIANTVHDYGTVLAASAGVLRQLGPTDTMDAMQLREEQVKFESKSIDVLKRADSLYQNIVKDALTTPGEMRLAKGMHADSHFWIGLMHNKMQQYEQADEEYKISLQGWDNPGYAATPYKNRSYNLRDWADAIAGSDPHKAAQLRKMQEENMQRADEISHENPKSK